MLQWTKDFVDIKNINWGLINDFCYWILASKIKCSMLDIYLSNLIFIYIFDLHYINIKSGLAVLETQKELVKNSVKDESLDFWKFYTFFHTK